MEKIYQTLKTNGHSALSSARAISPNKQLAFLALLATAAVATNSVVAATTGAEFSAFYNFIYEAATGYLGRGIALAGGVIGLGMGAASGKALPAVVGIVLALFGALGPTIVNAIFGSAII